jgi:hypothetical protein
MLFRIGCAFVESDFTVEDDVETFRIFLLLVNEGLLLELGDEHAAAKMVDNR